MTESWSPAGGNPYQPPAPGQPSNGQPAPEHGQPVPPYAQQPFAQPYGQPYGQQPYAQSFPSYGPPSYAPPRRTNGMATSALVTGIVAALLSVVSFFVAVATLGGAGALVLGVVAAVLGLVAVVVSTAGIRRSDVAGGRGRAIGGFLAGGVALLLGALTAILSVPALDATTGDSGSAVAQDDAAADAKDPRDEPADPASALDGIAAPAGSTANGGIPVGPSGVAGSTDGAASDAVVVTLYSDYMCPFCGEFESINGATLSELRAQGDIIIEYHPVAILDRLSQGSAYSTRAAAAAALVADRAPEAFVGFDTALFAQQPAEGTVGWTDAEFAGIARGAGVPEEVAVVIESGQYLTGADSFVPWVTAATEQGARDLGSMSTPTVLLDGAPLTVDWGIPGALAQAIEHARAT